MLTFCRVPKLCKLVSSVEAGYSVDAHLHRAAYRWLYLGVCLNQCGLGGENERARASAATTLDLLITASVAESIAAISLRPDVRPVLEVLPIRALVVCNKDRIRAK